MRLSPLVSGLAAIGVWQTACWTGLVAPALLASPAEVGLALVDLCRTGMPPGRTLPMHAWMSLTRVLTGTGLAVALGTPIGLALGASPRLRGLIMPLVDFIRPIPPLAWIPLAILWFGLGNPPSFFLISIGAFFPVLMNTIAGVNHVDGIYLRAARNLGVGSWTMFTRVILPAATPYILAGVRIGIGTAFIVVIVSEMIAVNDGLGFRILEAREFMWSDKIIAGMLTIGLLGLAIDTAISRLNNHLLRWHRGLEH